MLSLMVTVAAADVKPAAMFSDHMVLQREMPVPVWGTAAAGESVTVTLGEQSKTAAADASGKWSLKLDPLKAGGPLVMCLQGKSNKVELKDVLVGDVWVGSGQSNMAGGVSGYAKNDEGLAKLAAATYPKLRLKKGGAGPWVESTPQNNAGFSAILFAFGARLQLDLDVPVGLMVGAVGGTPSGNWLSQEALDADAACQAMIEKCAATYDPAAHRRPTRRPSPRGRRTSPRPSRKARRGCRPSPRPPFKPGDCTRARPAVCTRPTSVLTFPTPSAACCGIRARAARRSGRRSVHPDGRIDPRLAARNGGKATSRSSTSRNPAAAAAPGTPTTR